MEYVSFADQNHAPSLTDVRLEYKMKTDEKAEIRKLNLGQVLLKEVPVLKYLKTTGNCENEGENKYGNRF